jgi:AbrB family looped-hinge helix DNA binding protein
MNAQTRTFRSNLTSKCQVTIPKKIRDALGLKAGDRVEFIIDEAGNARILPVTRESEIVAHKQRFADTVAEAKNAFRPLGMTNKEFYDLMRGPPAEV